MRLFLLMISLMFPVGAFAVSSVPYEDLQCLTDNIYFEARGEPILGQVMVGLSVLNRVNDTRWPNTVCKVVYQRKQYSWTLERKAPIKDRKTYLLINDLAYTLLVNKDQQYSFNVTNYLRCDWRDKVDWWKEMEFIGQIGEHCFYSDN
ncbi:endolysin [Vibrio phage CHOED]|uniref:endolysin n=1 Tax=Vibrio phage CHOED TaxID=1458716 RepID=UPI00042EE526|nr:endolysin [Vibrio phage CHOED]AHK11931.1 cell wall hydrolase [Vibrio phage CHOED]